MVYICIILVDFGFWCLVVTYFDFWWSQRLFSEKAVGKRVVGSGSVTKLAIDQLKPRRSSLSATSVCAVQASAPQYIAIHCPSALSTRPCTAFSVYVITLHCVGASERIALFALYITSHITMCTLDIALCTALARQSTG